MFILKFIGFIWSLPITILALIYTFFLSLTGNFKFYGVENWSFIWIVKNPLSTKWNGWSGLTLGCVIIVKYPPHDKKWRIKLLHEMHHVKQYMLLGILFFPLYGIGWLLGGCKYRNNWFEKEARKVSGDDGKFDD